MTEQTRVTPDDLAAVADATSWWREAVHDGDTGPEPSLPELVAWLWGEHDTLSNRAAREAYRANRLTEQLAERPTADAYTAACAALEKHRAVEGQLLASLAAITIAAGDDDGTLVDVIKVQAGKALDS